VLRCRSNLGAVNVAWTRRTEVDGQEKTIVFRCSFDSSPEVSPVYSLMRNDSSQHCDLVISSVETSFTGIYKCAESRVGGQTAQAYLTIIGQFFIFIRFL